MVTKLQNSIHINGQKISSTDPPFVIAEISANHNGELSRALAIISEAKKAGADAVKLQTYTAETITLNSKRKEFKINGGLWHGRTLYDLYSEAYLPWEWHKPLFEKANEVGLSIFSSPFDKSAVDFLEKLNAPAYKVASFEAIDLPLIEYIAATGKPMIISTGMANFNEISEAIEAARSGGCNEIAILHCVSGYPAPAEEYNLTTITHMIESFGLPTGLSDHTLDNTTAIASVALGASIIEKHFTLDRNAGGPDDSFSLEPVELEALCKGVKTSWLARGKVSYDRQASENQNVKFRRSLYFVKDINKGDKITEDSIRSVRPGYGLAPKFFKTVLGAQLTKNVKKNTPVHLSDLKLISDEI